MKLIRRAIVIGMSYCRNGGLSYSILFGGGYAFSHALDVRKLGGTRMYLWKQLGVWKN